MSRRFRSKTAEFSARLFRRELMACYPSSQIPESLDQSLVHAKVAHPAHAGDASLINSDRDGQRSVTNS
jgi:hypothetical protein